MGGFEFHEQKRDAVDESHEVGPPLIHLSYNPKLGDQEEIIVGVVVPSPLT